MQNVTVKRVYDQALVKEVLLGLWPNISDDTPLDEETFQPFMTDDARWYATYEDGELVSLWFVHRLNFIMWQIHTHFLKKYWGKDYSTRHGKAVMKKIWTNTKARKLYALIPAPATPVLALAKRLGFKQEGRIKNSYQKDGEILDLIQLGVYR